VPETVKSVPGVWGNVLSFLGGAHACIGYRFSLLEFVLFLLLLFISGHALIRIACDRTKIILHALISAFEFELATPKEDIGAKRGVVTRPCVRSRIEEGAQLPLRMRRAPVTATGGANDMS
jgi:hypothetical protein